MSSIHPMATQLEIYEEIGALSARMVSAARDNDWERLIELEHHVVVLRDSLATADVGSNPKVEIERKRVLVQRILEDDAEVRCHTEPWMEHVRKYLGDSSRRRDVQKAYAAGAGESATGGFGT